MKKNINIKKTKEQVKLIRAGAGNQKKAGNCTMTGSKTRYNMYMWGVTTK